MEFYIPHRQKEGRIHHHLRVDRYWRNKVTRTVVEVRKHLLVDGQYQQIIFFDPVEEVELSLRIDEMRQQYDPVGNFPPGGRASYRKRFKGN